MPRRGSLLVEVSMAAVLVSVAMIAVAQLLAISARQEHEIERRRLALQEASNALEQVLTRPWESLARESLPEWTLPPDAQQRLPAGQLQFEVENIDGPSPAKRITALVSWRAPGGDRDQVQLTAWRFEPRKANP